jgi:hypothetical protein
VTSNTKCRCLSFLPIKHITRVKKTQLDAQLIPSIFRQLLHVSGVSRPITRRCKLMYSTIIATYYSVVLVGLQSNPTSTTDSHPKKNNKYQLLYNTVVPPDDGPRYARNMYRLTKSTKNMLCIKLVFLYTIIPRDMVN